MVLWGCVGCCQIGFYELNRLQKRIRDKTQLSCIYHVNVHDEYFCSMCSTGFLPYAESTSRSIHKLVHDVVTKKDML